MEILRALFSLFLLILNTVICSLLLYPLIILKVFLPKNQRGFVNQGLVKIAETWVSINSRLYDIFQNTEWDIEGPNNLGKNQSYLITCNHQSWFDIFVLQKVFNRRIPFLRFFIKQELIYVPLLGGAWWGLDFPFMKRYSKEYLDQHPEKRGTDLETTRKACEKFQGHPVSIINFLEGTRFTSEKHRQQESPFRYLLRPKAGGVAFVLQAMGDQFSALLDVTLIYPQGDQNLWNRLKGRKNKIIVRYRLVEIPDWAIRGDYMNNEDDRLKFQNWISDLWATKDQMIQNYLG